MTNSHHIHPVALAPAGLRRGVVGRLVVAVVAALALLVALGADPAWAASSAASTPAAVVAQTATGRDPALGVELVGDRISAVSESPAPLTATVASLPSGAVVGRLSFAPNAGATLGLPSGAYRVCVAQPAVMPWAAAGRCATASVRGSAAASIHVDSMRASGRRVALTVTVRAAGWQRALVGRRAWTARVQITLARGVSRRAAGVIAMPDVCAVTRRLHSGRQVLRLRLPTAASGGRAIVRLQVVATVRGGRRIALGDVAARVRIAA
ncbi:MAG: hypothetical protein ACRDMX_10650 [Solirubrobacteraceae bacterium]